MLRNYLKIAFRQLKRQNLYSIVNLLGLTISITCSILLFLFLRKEFNYDRFHTDSSEVYRIASNVTVNGNDIITPTTPPALVPSLENTAYCRIYTQSGSTIGVYDRIFYDDNIYAVDDSFFDIFSFEIIRGDQKKYLSSEDEIVLTESLAIKLFGDADPLGKKVTYNNKSKIVSAVISDPYNSHMNFSGLVRYSSTSQSWVSFSVYSYIASDQTVKEIESDLAKIYKVEIEPLFAANNSSCEFYLQPLEDIYLHSHLQGELDINGNITINYAFILVGFFMLVVAGINYTNMATARSLKRAKEIGIRKAIGSYHNDLIRQFLIESMLLVFFGVFLSLIAIDILLPYFKFLIGSGMVQIDLLDWQLVMFLFLVILVIGVAGGVYPAFYMARFNAADILKGTFQDHTNHLTTRRFLIIIQFTISVLLIICTWVVMSQMRFVNERNIGYNKDNVLIIKIPESSSSKYEEVVERFSKISQVRQIGSSELVPGTQAENLSTFYLLRAGEPQSILAKYFAADNGFIKSLDISVVAGENLSEGGQIQSEALVNETFAMMVTGESQDIIGRTIQLPFRNTQGRNQVRIRGVINDFHFKSLHEKVQPLIILYDRLNPYILIKLDDSGGMDMNELKIVFNQVYPDAPFDYEFAEDKLNVMYRSDILTGRIFGTFALITSFLALLGIFALSFYTSELRKKEISIRKINGASIRQILLLVSKEYIILVTIAAVVSWPFAYYILDGWLREFEYRIDIRWEVFIFSLLIAVTITLITVSLNSLKAARSNIVSILNRN